MCGFVGIVGDDISPSSTMNILYQMEKYLEARGPDARGEFIGTNAFFLHRRLGILGESKNASQPMLSRNKEWLLTFNGEIYNFEQLSKKYDIRSNGSDTRVFVELLSKFGVNKTLSLLNGMYSFVAVNLKENWTSFAVDRYGQKPLYYESSGAKITFSSDLRAFSYYKRRVNLLAEDYFLRSGYVPGALSFLDGVQKALPGYVYTYKSGILTFKNLPLNERKNYRLISLADVEEAVKEHLVSDYPLFSFLSSGIDSSIITALASRFSQIESFTFAYGKGNADETAHAKKVAQYLGVKHHVISAEDTELEAIFHNIDAILSEPLGDPATLALYLMCEAIKECGFKVGLTGDGGDEIFGGYLTIEQRYKKLMERKKFDIPLFLKNLSLPTKLGRELKKFFLTHDRTIESELDLQYTHSAGDFFGYGSGDGSERRELKEILAANDFHKFYRLQMHSKFCPKIDFASSNCSVELRTPFLSDRLANYQGSKKSKLEIYERLIPEKCRNYEKKGFGIDLKRLILKDGRGWVNDNIELANEFYGKDVARRLKIEARALNYNLADINFIFRYCQAISWRKKYT